MWPGRARRNCFVVLAEHRQDPVHLAHRLARRVGRGPSPSARCLPWPWALVPARAHDRSRGASGASHSALPCTGAVSLPLGPSQLLSERWPRSKTANTTASARSGLRTGTLPGISWQSSSLSSGNVPAMWILPCSNSAETRSPRRTFPFMACNSRMGMPESTVRRASRTQ